MGLSGDLAAAFKGVLGAKPPAPNTEAGGVGGGPSALTRGGSRKKIGYDEEHAERENR